MSNRATAYASALLEVASAEGVLERVEAEIHSVNDLVAGNDQLRSKLTDQTIPAAVREGIVEDLLAGKAHPVTTSLVSFIVGSGRGPELGDITDQFLDMAARRRGGSVAVVRSAVPLSDEQRQRLADALRERAGSQVTVQVTVDPTVLGGLVVELGDTVIDGSIRHRLDGLRAAI